jgi:hypothetical protein
MFGIIFGTLCLIGFIAVLRRRYGWRRWGRHHYRGHGYGHHRSRFWGLYRLFEELDTSPGQEKAIRSAVAELRTSVGGLRPHLEETRQQVAAAIASDVFDADRLEQTLGAELQQAFRLESAVVAALGKIHEALDTDQRRRLARFVNALPHASAC